MRVQVIVSWGGVATWTLAAVRANTSVYYLNGKNMEKTLSQNDQFLVPHSNLIGKIARHIKLLLYVSEEIKASVDHQTHTNLMIIYCVCTQERLEAIG